MHRFIPLVFATIAFAAPVSMAQDEESSADFKAFRFQGGTVISFLEAVEEAFPEPDLVIFPGGLEKIMVPAMNVRTTGSSALLEIAEGLTVKGDGWIITPRIDWVTDEIVVIKPQVNGNPLAAAQSQTSRSVVRVYSLPIGAMMEDTLGALEAGLTMTGDDTAVIQFHEPTGIIFVNASEEAQGVADNVLHEISKSLNFARSTQSRRTS